MSLYINELFNRTIFFFFVLFLPPMILGTLLAGTGFAYAVAWAARNRPAELKTHAPRLLSFFLIVPLYLLLFALRNEWSNTAIALLFTLAFALAVETMIWLRNLRPLSFGTFALCGWLIFALIAASSEMP